jgi:hypothetical protein
MNLFWSTHMLATEKEDHLTEFLAAALEESHEFRAAYAEHILGDFAKSRGWPPPKITNVKTKVKFPGIDYRPDMVITLADGKTIVCEHKFDAPATLAEAEEQRTRLKQYLDLSIDGLIYIRISHTPPGDNVLEHQKYICPCGREHFLWNDLYPLLSCDDHLLLNWMREGFEWMGFTQDNPIT